MKEGCTRQVGPFESEVAWGLRISWGKAHVLEVCFHPGGSNAPQPVLVAVFSRLIMGRTILVV